VLTLISRSAYDVFGERSLAAGADLGQTFGFTGREHDASGLVYSRNRYLAPSVGTWTRPDPYSFAELRSSRTPLEPGAPILGLIGHSQYPYIAPTRATDPLGLWVKGVGFGFDIQLLFGGFEVYGYRVWDDRGGRGFIVTPAYRTFAAVGFDAPAGAAFYAPSARDIFDMEGVSISGSLGLAAVSLTVGLVQYSTDYGVCEPDGDDPDKGVGASYGASAGFGIMVGLTLSIGYTFLWVTRAPR
jgi:RHS repeat-associated protein